MAKKGGSGKSYTSKGERPNVSRSIRNDMRRENRRKPTWRAMSARLNYEQEIAVRKDSASKEAYKKLLDVQAIEKRALELQEKYSKANVTWAACKQAVVTDWVAQFEAKYANKLNSM